MLEEKEIDLRNVKLMGGIGMILPFLSFVPYIGGACSIAGLVLVLIALKTLSDKTKRASIFEDYLKGFICMLVMAIIWIIIGFFLVGATTVFLPKVSNKVSLHPEPFYILFFVVGIFITWIAWVIGSYFIRRSFKTIAELTKEKMFETSGLLLFWGAALAIIVVGAISR